jgi:hypothetical protein
MRGYPRDVPECCFIEVRVNRAEYLRLSRVAALQSATGDGRYTREVPE